MLSLNNVGEYRADKFDQSGLEWNNEYYFRYSVNWFTIFVTLGIIGFTLFSIALKLAKLFFELTFNYILALIVAPADIHDGQKTKKIIQSILNTFFATILTILIFLSMKVYMIGTAYLEDTLSTFPYLIALIAFSLAVVDGPNIVERLFGTDAGLKNGWGVLAGAYAGGRMVAGLGKGISNIGKSDSDNKNKSLSAMSGGAKGEKAPSPNDEENESDKNKNGNGVGKLNASARNGLDENKSPSPNDAKGIVTTTGTNGDSQSPTSNAQTTSRSHSTDTSNVTDNTTVRTDSKLTGIQDNVQGSTTGLQTGTMSGSVPQSPTNNQQGGTSNAQTTSSSQATETARVTNNSTATTDNEVANVVQEIAGNTSISTTRTGGVGTQAPTERVNTCGANNTDTNGSHTTETSRVTSNSTVTTDTEISNSTQEVAGTTTTRSSRTSTGNENPKVDQSSQRRRPRNYSIDNGNKKMIDKMKNHKNK